jgi:hypothetical protein
MKRGSKFLRVLFSNMCVVGSRREAYDICHEVFSDATLRCHRDHDCARFVSFSTPLVIPTYTQPLPLCLCALGNGDQS